MCAEVLLYGSVQRLSINVGTFCYQKLEWLRHLWSIHKDDFINITNYYFLWIMGQSSHFHYKNLEIA